jgi:hypothetical protein
LVKGKQVRIADKPPLIYHFTRKSDARHRINAERIFAAYKKRLPPERLRFSVRQACECGTLDF